MRSMPLSETCREIMGQIQCSVKQIAHLSLGKPMILYPDIVKCFPSTLGQNDLAKTARSVFNRFS